jgi:hypothetical protein
MNPEHVLGPIGDERFGWVGGCPQIETRNPYRTPVEKKKEAPNRVWHACQGARAESQEGANWDKASPTQHYYFFLRLRAHDRFAFSSKVIKIKNTHSGRHTA